MSKIQRSKRSKLPRLSRCQNCLEDLYIKNERAPPSYLDYQEAHDVQIAKGSELPRCRNSQKVLDIKNPRAPLRNPKVREIHTVKRSKCPRAPSRGPHHQKPSFSLQLHFLYCKRPIIGADESNVVKANFVQACNQR